MTEQQEQKSRTFKAGFNGETYILLMFPAVIAAILLILGIQYNQLFPPQADIFSRQLFVYMPLALSALIVIVTILTVVSNLLIQITVTPEKLTFKQGKKEFECQWRTLAFAPPSPNKKYFKTLTISDGSEIARIHSSFFPSFDILVKFIRMAKGEASKAGYDI